MVFSSLFSFGSILAHQTSSGMFSEWFRFIWHPWGPWGRVNSGEKGFSGQTATVDKRIAKELEFEPWTDEARNGEIYFQIKVSHNRKDLVDFFLLILTKVLWKYQVVKKKKRKNIFWLIYVTPFYSAALIGHLWLLLGAK